MKAALLLCLLFFSSCAFAQVKKQRLIAQAGYSSDISIPNSWKLADSASLSYSGVRHSEFDYSAFEYFNLPNSYSQVGKINGMVAPNNIDSISYSQRVAFDTLRYYNFDNSNHVLQLAWTDAVRYFSDGKCAETYHTVGREISTTTYHYIFDRLTRAYITVATNANPPDTFSREQRYIVYDALGYPVIDSTVGTIPVIFEYDAMGRYVNWHFRTAFLCEYSYYPDGRVRTRITSEPDSGIYGSKYLDSFSYMPGVSGYISRKSFLVDYPNRISPTVTESFHINALGQKDTLTIAIPGWTTRQVAYLVYNSYGNPEAKYYESYNEIGLLSRTKTVYYYEDYDPSLSTESTAKSHYSITLSPNPTTGTMTLHYGSAILKDRVTVTISNILGQVVHSESFIPRGSNTDIVLGSDAAPGIYCISVLASDNNVLYKGTVLKQ